MAVFTQERRTGYNDGQQLAANLMIMSKKDARRVLRALHDDRTVIDVYNGDNSPYAQAYRKGFVRRMIDRCEFYLCHADE